MMQINFIIKALPIQIFYHEEKSMRKYEAQLPVPPNFLPHFPPGFTDHSLMHPSVSK